MSTRAIIDQFASSPTTANMECLINTFKGSSSSEEDIAHLAFRLAESGKQLGPFDESIPVADVPSTGGPSSLSTLLCPLQLVSLGAMVPKLGIPGRPAGGIDVLACIPGYRVTLDTDEILRCLRGCGYAHFIAGTDFAPLDARLFDYRLLVQAIAIPRLAIASLLSKKVALGIRQVALDVRVASHTNFGSTWDEARDNARIFIRVAQRLSISAKCYLTDATLPYQPFIGRGESLIALSKIFSGIHDPELKEHLDLCSSIATACVEGDAHASNDELAGIFAANLEQQGASIDSFARKVTVTQAQPTMTLMAKSDGYLTVDLNGIRSVLVDCQTAAESRTEAFSDPCGLTLVVHHGTLVQKGDALARIRAVAHLENVADQLSRFVQVSDDLPARQRAPELVT